MSNVTVVGYFSENPDLNYTPSGKPVAKFRIGEKLVRTINNEKVTKWVNYNCEAWGSLAENIVASASKGDLFVFTGHFEDQEWTNKDNEKRTSKVFVVDECGPSLRFNSVEVTRNARE